MEQARERVVIASYYSKMKPLGEERRSKEGQAGLSK